MLLLNLFAYAVQANADGVIEAGWQDDTMLASGAGQLAIDNRITGIEITRSDCLRKAISDLLNKLGIMSRNDRNLGVVITDTRRSARFGQMYMQSDHSLTFSDDAVELELTWQF